MNSFWQNFYVFAALTKRNYKILYAQLKDSLIDKLILVSTYVVVFGHFYPLLGMSKEYVAPIYIGNFILLFFSLASSLSIAIVFDLQYQRFINYLLTLPISKRWLFAAYIVDFATHLFVTTLPLFLFGTLLLGHLFSINQAHWPLFLCMYLLSIFFVATLLIMMTFRYPYHWYMANLWPRRISILLTTSTVFISWYLINDFAPRVSYIFLCNPLTYMIEGLRATLLGPERYIGIGYCISALVAFTCITVVLLAHAIKRRLDPV